MEEGNSQALPTNEVLQHRVDYIRRNPVQRGMVATAEDWRYSSAHEWREGTMPVMRCDPWR